MRYPVVNPGRVEWSGEDLDIYFQGGSSDFNSKVPLLFHATLSPHRRDSACTLRLKCWLTGRCARYPYFAATQGWMA